MDLQKFDFKNSAARQMKLSDPTTDEALIGTDGNPIVFTLHGADTDVVQKAIKDYGNEKLRKGRKSQTVESAEGTASKILALATVNWTENFVINGELIPFNTANAEWLYNEYSWIKEQVDAFISLRSNFLPTA